MTVGVIFRVLDLVEIVFNGTKENLLLRAQSTVFILSCVVGNICHTGGSAVERTLTNNGIECPIGIDNAEIHNVVTILYLAGSGDRSALKGVIFIAVAEGVMKFSVRHIGIHPVLGEGCVQGEEIIQGEGGVNSDTAAHNLKSAIGRIDFQGTGTVLVGGRNTVIGGILTSKVSVTVCPFVTALLQGQISVNGIGLNGSAASQCNGTFHGSHVGLGAVSKDKVGAFDGNYWCEAFALNPNCGFISNQGNAYAEGTTADGGIVGLAHVFSRSSAVFVTANVIRICHFIAVNSIEFLEASARNGCLDSKIGIISIPAGGKEAGKASCRNGIVNLIDVCSRSLIGSAEILIGVDSGRDRVCPGDGNLCKGIVDYNLFGGINRTAARTGTVYTVGFKGAAVEVII